MSDTNNGNGTAPSTGGGAEGITIEQARNAAESGALAESENICRQLVAKDPGDAAALYLLGWVSGQLGHIEEGINRLAKVLRMHPNDAKAHNAVGTLLLQVGKRDDARKHFSTAVEIDPTMAAAHNNLGSVELSMGGLDAAEAAFKKAIEANPDGAMAVSNLATVALRRGRLDEAIAGFRDAISRAPDSAMGYNNLGEALRQKGDHAEAISVFEKAIEVEPGMAKVITNLGTVYRDMGDYETALMTYDRALECEPEEERTLFLRALLCLARGSFEDGWEGFRHRPWAQLIGNELYREALPDSLAHIPLVLRREPGYGDELFFLRFVSLLRERGAANIAYQPGRNIESLARRVDGLTDVIDPDATPDATVWNVALGDLPSMLGAGTAASIPPPVRILPDPESYKAVKGCLEAGGPGPYIGIAWRVGGAETSGRIERQVPFDALAEILKPLKGTLVILQRNPDPAEIEILNRTCGRTAVQIPGLEAGAEMMLAAMSLVDSCISMASPDLNLRAAADKPAQVFVSNQPEFRWMAEGDETPWYPGFRLHRQGADGDWSAALGGLANHLEAEYGA